MPYSQAELDQAIEQVVRTSVRFEYDPLGVRKTGTTFNDVQDAAAGVFISNPNAAYWVVRLGADRLLELVKAEEEQLGSFITTVRAVGRNVSPVRKLSFLANARTALDALATATGQRASAFLDLEDVPAYNRFNLNTQKFLDAEGVKATYQGDVVETPQQARQLLAGLAKDLRATHDELIRRVGAIQASIPDYNTLNLSERLSRDIMQNAHDVLAARFEELEAQDPEARLQSIRAAVLDVLTARAVVKGFGALAPQTLFLLLEGTGGPFASASLPATPAELQSSLVGPYRLFDGQDKLTLVLEGVDTLELQLPQSFVPFLQVPARGPFEVTTPANQFKISLTSWPDVNVTVTPVSPATVDPWDLVDLINAAVTTQPLTAHLDFIPIKTTQSVDVDVTGSPNDADFILPVAVGTWASLGVVVGDRVLVKDPTSSMDDDLFEVVSFPTAQTASTNIVRAGALTDELGKTVQLGTDKAVIWTVEVDQASATAALDNRWVLRVDNVEDETLQRIGMYPGSEVRARKTTAQAIEQFLNINAATQVNGVARLEALSTFVEASSSKGRTVPDDPNTLVLYAFRGTGNITAGGLTATFVLPDLDGELVPGSLLVLRETSVAADMGKVGTVATVVGTTVTATFSSSVSTATGVLVEGGPNPSGLVDQTLRISEGSLQDGDYIIDAVDGLDLSVGSVVAITNDLGGLPFFFEDVSVGSFRLDLKSTSTTLTSSVEVVTGTDDASGEFFTAVPTEAVGTTTYFQLPETPKNLEAGDQIEVHNTSVASPDLVRVVKQLLEGNVVELETAVSVVQPAVTFTKEQPIPFGRIRKRVVQTFDEFAERLATWLENNTSTKVLHYFRELDAFLNTLVVNTNPTPGQINNAVFHLQQLLGTLTVAGATSTGANPLNSLESMINDYEAAIVPAAENLIASYEQKGADRAKQILLEGRFSDFFGLDRDEVSHAGYVQKLIKDVSREDLPIRKNARHDRDGVAFDNQLASWDDTDFEYKPEDLEPNDLIDIPGEGDLVPNIPVP